MFATSTQRQHWIFDDEEDIWKLQEKANSIFIQKSQSTSSGSSANKDYLTVDEEVKLKHYYTSALKEFSARFKPDMPRTVSALALNYLKRFYLNNSVMNYHPRDIMLTCAFHACKVDEFNVTLKQFVANIKGDRAKHTDVILSFEHLLMGQLKFHLTIHLPYRPLEGLLIFFKTYYPEENGEFLRESALQFIDQSLISNVSLLFAPSQIALAALKSSASKMGVNFTEFVKQQLCEGNEEIFQKSLDQVDKIVSMVSAIQPFNRSAIKAIETKLSQCRNYETDPRSEAYQRKMDMIREKEEERQTEKFAKASADQKLAEEQFLGI